MSSDSRTKILKAFFTYLQDNDIPYCLVGDTEKIPYFISSDIDIVISNKALENFFEKLAIFSTQQQVRLVQVLKHEQTSFYYIFAWSDNSWNIEYLHPDICSDYFHDGKLLLTANDMLSSRKIATGKDGTSKGFFILSPEREFIYYLIKKIEKLALNQQHFRHLQCQYQQCSELCFQQLQNFFPLNVSESISNSFKAGNLKALQDIVPRLHNVLKNRPSSLVKERWREFIRKIQRVLHPTGLIIALLGPDGCGKSTVGERLQQQLSPAFRGIKRYHLRPNLHWCVSKKSNKEPVTDPHGLKPRGFIATISKLFYFLIDYTGGYWLLIRPLKVRSHLVIFDRYYHDIFIDPIRYRYGAPIWAAKLLGFLLPEPDLFLILDAPSEVVQKRKNEVPLEETRRQRNSYLAFAKSKSNCIVVNSDQAIENAACEASLAVLDYMEKRLLRRQGRI